MMNISKLNKSFKRRPIMSPWRTHKILKMFTAAKSFCSTTIAAILIAMTLTLTVSPATTLAATSPKPDHMPPVTQCKMSEHTCTNGKCVPLNKYCNNVNDCGDGSDEPRFCTRCNRTYYGDQGFTYSLELHRPKEDKIPYICLLTFTAAGGVHGDIVQVTLESFTLGRFTSYTQDGCPDGYLQVSEAARTPIGGMWCGTSWGPVIFYSETRSLVLMVKLNKLARDQSGYNFDFRVRYKVLSRESAVVRYGGIKFEDVVPWHNGSSAAHSNSIEDFSNHTALTDRYRQQETNPVNGETKDGNLTTVTSRDAVKDNETYSEPKYYLGDLIPGTYCSRIFSDCDRKNCRLQSPNFPGIYPRNLTCYYAIRQHDIPHGKHALIIVKQPKGNLVWVATQTGAVSQSSNTNDKDKKFQPRIKTWQECDYVQDYITIYDGYTTRDPIILKFCGGGQSLPASISSGPELLVEFTTSPYGTFVGTSSQVTPLYGFLLEVEVKFVDQQTAAYVKNKKLCEFWVRGTGYGVLESPKHSLAPNTTCLYHLQGTTSIFRSLGDQLPPLRRTSQQQQAISPSRFKIWLSILKFELAPPFGLLNEATTGMQTQEDCNGMLRVWDGPLREPPVCKDLNCGRDSHRGVVSKYSQNNASVIARFCYGTIPRSCDRVNINDTHARPCTISESFVSSSDSITLELKNAESTALRPLNFKLRYEFVDLYQDGIPIFGTHECNRKFVSGLIERREPTTFRSIRNIFLFGRGGARNLNCTYRFEAQRGERIHIVIRKVITKNRKCSSQIDRDINRSYCFGNTDVRIEIFEHPYQEVILLPRGCICNSSNSSMLPVEYTSTSREVEVRLTAINMTTLDDPDTIRFEGTYEFIKAPLTCKDSRRKFGPSGTVDMTFGDMECRTRPWVIEPSNGNKFLYLRLRGIFIRKHNPLLFKPMNTSLSYTLAEKCPTPARVVLTTGEGASITACPLDENSGIYEYVEIFSAGWKEKTDYEHGNPSKVISVEFLRPENGEYSFTWMEMIPRPPLGLVEDCKYRCTALGACVNATVWCDGIVHCPSGEDESFLQCSPILKLPAEILATLCIVIILFCCGFIAFAYRKIKRKCRGSSVLQTRLKSLSSMDTPVFDEKDVIC
ncbi:uncharacterized protein LOC119649946 isoform X2 [Hermetia illucens]|nr:uncharacterized protein LOC119649946 isoform X2 [Hermetia illucens]